ncbi:MAG: HAD family phosphatase [Eubacterium sp.]|nr:HAD family phosphatase [Eubacterium sp.]
MISGAIFDVDGTLLDSMPVWHNCGVRYLESIGVKAEPGLGDFLFTQTNASGAVYMVDHYGLDLSPEEVADGMSRDMENYYFNSPEMKEGAAELLDRFEDAGIPMTVATSTDKYLLDGAFRKLGIGHYFKAVLSCGDYGTTKGEPLIFNKASEVMGTDPSETWVFEDGLYAIKTASKAGFRTVAVYDKISSPDWEEMSMLADEHVDKLSDFIEIQI